jgi:hypothetical protein
LSNVIFEQIIFELTLVEQTTLLEEMVWAESSELAIRPEATNLMAQCSKQASKN